MDLIYCAGQNSRLMQIAYECGYLLGIRSDLLDFSFPISFVDIDYKQPDFAKHLETVKKHSPKYATVPDLSETRISEADIERAVLQAEQLSSYCEIPLIVPKLSSQLHFIPTKYAIAYSVPTSYGGAKYGLWKLEGRRVHLLGGSPHTQMKLQRYLSECVQSADGNMAQKMATQYAKYWQGGRWRDHPQRGKGIEDLYVDCWKRSCQNIYQQWQWEVPA
jgi:hypothetical protein